MSLSNFVTPRETDHPEVLFGVVWAVENNEAIVTIDGEKSPPLPWMENAGPDFKTRFPPEEGEQVVVLVPDGDIVGGIILRGIPSNQNPLPNDVNKIGWFFNDGKEISFDKVTREITLAATKIKIAGDLEVTGKIDASGDIKSGDISLTNHKHLGVKSGAEITGVAQ